MLKWEGVNNLWLPIPIYRGETMAIIASGPSLTQEQVDLVMELPTIAVNDAYKLAPWADILYACDAKWWNWHNPEFAGRKVGLKWNAITGSYHANWAEDIHPDVWALASTGTEGLEDCPNGLKTGANSGYQAINLAVHLGAKRILLLGFDMQAVDGKNHWFGEHPDGVSPPYDNMLLHFPSIVEPLKKRGVEVINCSPDSILDVFPKMPLEEFLCLA